jgi:ATP phosphoribosyltransferase
VRPAANLTLALPKGRLGAAARAVLLEAGLPLAASRGDRAQSRVNGRLAVLELRNHDVPIYVDLGTADLGVVGKEVIVESGRDVYEPVDLGVGRCRLSLIQPAGATGRIERVATKYPRISRAFLARQGIAAEVVELAGNVELACVTGLADAVVDVVETGRTLRDNGLEERAVILHSSARLVVNRAALKLKRDELRSIIEAARGAAAARRS